MGQTDKKREGVVGFLGISSAAFERAALDANDASAPVAPRAPASFLDESGGIGNEDRVGDGKLLRHAAERFALLIAIFVGVALGGVIFALQQVVGGSDQPAAGADLASAPVDDWSRTVCVEASKLTIPTTAAGQGGLFGPSFEWSLIAQEAKGAENAIIQQAGSALANAAQSGRHFIYLRMGALEFLTACRRIGAL